MEREREMGILIPSEVVIWNIIWNIMKTHLFGCSWIKVSKVP